MKKISIISIVLFIVFIFQGCGQKMYITVYNTCPIYGAQNIQFVASTEHHGESLIPSDSAASDIECNTTNSVAFQGVENDNLKVSASGVKYSVDSSGNTTLVTFTVPTASQLLYSNMFSTSHWYGAVDTDSVTFYKK
jgi:hypothetical protein